MQRVSAREDGGRKAAVTFKSIWAIDFEFRQDALCRPVPVCLVALDLVTKQELRFWRDELLQLKQPPFDVGPESLVLGFYIPAELGCFLALGWQFPRNLLDLFVEHRVSTNGERLLFGNSLIGALRYRGLAHIDASEKEAMIRLICDQNSWSDEQRKDILNYCASDVYALSILFDAMDKEVDLPRALLRGRYMAAVARMEWHGIPIDMDWHRQLAQNWRAIRGSLVAAVDLDFGVYEGLTFKEKRFANLVAKRGIDWPRTEKGHLKVDKDTFKAQARRWPEFEPLRELRDTLGGLRLNNLTVGSDGRNRAMLSPFASVTGRNQPSTSKSIFGPSRWLRGLIKPAEGYGLAYIDFASQEIGIAAALSGDELMMSAYREGDPYLAFAKQAKLVPPDATSQTHKAVRDRCKEVVLGVQYGMGAVTMAEQAGIAEPEAKHLLKAHRGTYKRFWQWTEDTVTSAMLTNKMQTVFGWKRKVKTDDKPTSLMNFPMQANGAEMMRIAAIAATEAGIEVCAPVHDAFLIAAPLHELDERTSQMRDIMSKAGEAVTGGLTIRTTAKLIRHPDRYVDERGGRMWDYVTDVARRLSQSKQRVSEPSDRTV